MTGKDESVKECFMRIGNCIPHDIPPENVKMYFDFCRELAHRG